MIHWDMNKHSKSAAEMEMLMRQVNRELSVAIDEVAIMVDGYDELEDETRSLQDQGWEEFNSAEDMVHTIPFGISYEVHYRFFRHPAWSWRIELMSGGTSGVGYSPLHEVLRTQDEDTPLGSGRPVVHFSYKVQSVLGLDAEAKHLTMNGYVHGQSCVSNYGRFSYWRKGITGPYVKPRVNLRDQASASPSPSTTQGEPA